MLIAATGYAPRTIAGATLDIEPLKHLISLCLRQATHVHIGQGGKEWFLFWGFCLVPNGGLQQEKTEPKDDGCANQQFSAGTPADAF